MKFPHLLMSVSVLAACSAPQPPADETDAFIVSRDLTRVPTLHRTTAQALIDAADALQLGERDRAGALLLQAAASSPQPHLANHLRAAHRTWLTGADQEQLEATLLACEDRPLVAPFHAAPGQALDTIQVGLIDAQEQASLDYFLENLHRVEEWLELGGEAPHPSKHRLVIAQVLARGGDVSPGSMHTRLPEDPSRRAEVGSYSVFWRTMLRERWWRAGVLPVAQRCLVPEDAAAVTPDAHLRWYATRFGSSQVGPHPDRETFGDSWGPLVIAKADAMGALVRVWLAEEGKVPPFERRQAACTFVAMAVRALVDAQAGEAPPAHELASRTELDWLFEREAIALFEGRLTVDVDKTLDAARELVMEIATLAVQRDGGRGKALMDRGQELPPQLEAAIAELAATPAAERVPIFR